MIEKQKCDRYEMHKYWGKKPAFGFAPLIRKYTKVGDTLLDPFAGYGVFCSEAFIAGRNVIVNDLNPIANFISKNLMERHVDLSLLAGYWKRIKKDFAPFVAQWYSCPDIEGQELPISVLRDRSHRPVRLRYGKGEQREIVLTEEQTEKYLCFENRKTIEDWFPTDRLLANSRISAREGMTVADLFTKRELACHSRLFRLINEYSSGAERDMMLLAFTANLANCSVLVPPITSRGEMSQGAWMTGFYIGETYIENNVLHYFENRLNKVIKGKTDFLSKISNDLFGSTDATSQITCYDAKRLKDIPDDSIDYVFTDPPYGDAVPYFEQSIIWNAWLKKQADFQNEIVVSNSCERNKDVAHYENDIFSAFCEIKRVLKNGNYFSLTYHSLSGKEWRAVTNACIQNGFEMVEYGWLTQKTFTPRQLNRTKTVKGDVLITLRNSNMQSTAINSKEMQTILIIDHLSQLLSLHGADTNLVMLQMMKWIFTERIVLGDVDVYEILKDNFDLDNEGLWQIRRAA